MCEHEYVFQETKSSTKVKTDSNGNNTATYVRIDRYYCSKCLDIKELEKKEIVRLPFGGIRNLSAYAPTWY